MSFALVVKDAVEYLRRKFLDASKLTKKHDNTAAAKTFKQRASEGKYKHIKRKVPPTSTVQYSYTLIHLFTCSNIVHFIFSVYVLIILLYIGKR
jgi:hypothetical protein